MKIVIKLILSFLLCYTTFADLEMLNGSVCTYELGGNPSYITLDPFTKTFSTNQINIFNTYTIGLNTFELTTSQNQYVNLLLANNTKIKVLPQSEFRIDGFIINIDNLPSYPSKIEINNYNLQLALMAGEAFFITEKTNALDNIILQTPVANIGLGTGKYNVLVDNKNVLIYILEGSLDVYDNITNKKENIGPGHVVLIHPAPKLSPQRLQIFSDKYITNVKKSKPEDTTPLQGVIGEMESVKNKVIFITISTNITAVKIK